ncbi:hypothetical protein GGF31_000833 [Allomyces arbusculus]|nr:hypothetical protein GGF31_000833 [Allomyces arbusculus]
MFARLVSARAAGASMRPHSFRYYSVAARPVIGVRRETKHKWERRTPVLPEHVEQLKNDGIEVIVQPSNNRIVGDERYRQAGATISEDLSKADVIVGIKEVELTGLIPNKSYLYFSHTHKGQPYNMGMLKDVLDKKIRLMDYELITNDKGQRQVMFGTFAGYSGMLDGLHALGLRLLGKGYGTPFLNVGMAHTYPTLQHAKDTLRDLGKIIEQDGLPQAFGPMLVVFTGTGNVSRGAQEVFQCLPHEYVKPSELKQLVESKTWSNKKIYATVVDVADHCVRKDAPDAAFDFAHYLANPDQYKSVFADKIAPYATMLVTGHYWDTPFPRLLTTEQAKRLYPTWKKNNRMITIADISCDIRGGLEFMSHAAKIDDPWFMYDPLTGSEHKDPDGEGVQIMSVDILPSELPLESSKYFGDKLLPYLKQMAKQEFESPVLKRATIAANGALEPRHAWLEGKLPSAITAAGEVKSPAAAASKRVVVLGSGFVAGPLVDYLLRDPHVHITLASNNVAEATALAATRDTSRIHVAEIEVSPTTVNDHLKSVLSTGDVIVSLVPATLHVPIAKECIARGKHMVTASYISKDMAALHADAQQAGVTIMNEVGLDPGIDHLTAKQFIDEVHAHGGQIEGFVSWCGGLPAPENSGNPLGYKFSWSPRGVLLAALNSAIYRMDGKEVTIPSERLLLSARDVNIYKGFALEGLPNRDSLSYIDQYELNRDHLKTMFRGTLRYKGYSHLVYQFRQLGLLATDVLAGLDRAQAAELSWPALLGRLLGVKNPTRDSLEPAIALRTGLLPTSPDLRDLLDAMAWLGMFDSSATAFPAGSIASAAAGPAALDATCARLQSMLVYEEGERDMVAMHHEFTVRTRAGKSAQHTATLITYGDPVPTGATAMAKTVGIPAAIATEMLLQGKMTRRGVLAPMHRDIYEPMLNVLTKEGVRFVEKARDL